MTGRQDFLLGLGAALGCSSAPGPQQKAMPMTGYVGTLSPGAGAPLVRSLQQGLAENGYVEGQNVAIEYRWAEGHLDQLPAFFKDLVDRKVDVISAGGSAAGAVAAKSATSTIPIVFAVGRTQSSWDWLPV